jgi:SAM-dependent methyltransferase
MTLEQNSTPDGRSRIDKAEFDRLADDYYAQHQENIAITGEKPEYFSEYKIIDVARIARERSLEAGRVLDFGCGIGNSVPYFRKHFPAATLTCADVSRRSIELAKLRFPGTEKYVLIEDGVIPVESGSQDLVFTACVMHHIPHEEHAHWLAELRRIVRPGGMLFVFEHNPLNPLTVRAVNTCPLDVNARLIRAGRLRRIAAESGWAQLSIDYRLFFPALAAPLRPLENHLRWLCLGAQYCLSGTRSAEPPGPINRTEQNR